MRVMAVDYGDARTGVAFSDPTGTLAGDAFTIHEHNEAALLDKLAALCAERGVTKIAVGYPKNMNGTLGPRAELCAAFADKLADKTGIPVTLWDERRTTTDAHRILSETGKRGKARKAVVDAVAAALILEGFLKMC